MKFVSRARKRNSERRMDNRANKRSSDRKKGRSAEARPKKHAPGASTITNTQDDSMEKLAEKIDRASGPTSLVMASPSDAAQLVMKRFAVVTLCKGIDNLLKEYAELAQVCQKPEPQERVFFDKNQEKNRYRDIYCLDKNRVTLNWPPVDGYQDYIHANWVVGLTLVPRKIICTQGPMENTVFDFWRMIWQEKCSSILMLCSVMEGGKKKCEQYWPAKCGEKITYPFLLMSIENTDVSLQGEVQVTKLVMRGKSRDGQHREHVVIHVLWSGWPDKSVPLSAVGAIRAIVRTQTFSPLVVHCSAGVGRTGTVVAIEASLRVLLAGQELSVYNIVKQLRSMRYLACQTDLQYLYVHRAILAYITSKKVLSLIDVSKFVDDYTALVNERCGVKQNSPAPTSGN